MNIQSDITTYLLATYELTELDYFLQSSANGVEYTGIDNPITLCLAESSYFIPALQDAYEIKKAQFQVFNADFSKKLNQFLESKPVQKPVTKNSVVCSIAAKLSKAGIKKPMTVAWQIYKNTLECLNALANKHLQSFSSHAFDLEYTLFKLGILPSQVLPSSVLTVFAKTGLGLA